MAKLHHHAKHTFKGAKDIFIKIFKVIIISVVLLTINRFTDYFFGRQLISHLIILGIILGFTLYSTIHKFSKATFFYFIGWIVGLYFLSRIPFLESYLETLDLALLIGVPLIFFIVRFIIFLYRTDEPKSVDNLSELKNYNFK